MHRIHEPTSQVCPSAFSTPPATPTPRDMLRVRDAASRLDVSVRSLYRLIHLGALKIVKVGRSTRITAKSIEDFIKKGGTA